MLPSMLPKISALRNNILKRNLATEIEVDGGVNLQTIEEVMEAGASIFVAGSAIFNENPTLSIQKMKEILYKPYPVKQS